MLETLENAAVFGTPGELAEVAARACLAVANDAIVRQGRFHIALAGGSTPRRLYQRLAALGSETDWTCWHLYFGDERCVPPDHLDSNYRMAREAWLDLVPIPAHQVHPMVLAPGNPQACARAYARTLEALPAEDGWPILDLILLGLGDDGHIASLFPESDLLEEKDHPVAAGPGPGAGPSRVTLTYPVLDRAKRLWFIVTGAAKRDIVTRIHRGEGLTRPLPVQALTPRGQIVWYLDHEAAAGITRGAGG